jgi:hypothetical protein
MRVSRLSRHLLYLEENLRLFVYSPLLLATRVGWRKVLSAFIAPTDDIKYDRYLLHHRYIDFDSDSDCDCMCCPEFHRYRYRRHDGDDVISTFSIHEQIEKLNESVQALRNGVVFTES